MVCSKCKRKIKEGANFCPYCGTKLKEEQEILEQLNFKQEKLDIVQIGKEASTEQDIEKSDDIKIKAEEYHNAPRENEGLDTIHTHQKFQGFQESLLDKEIPENVKENQGHNPSKENEGLDTLHPDQKSQESQEFSLDKETAENVKENQDYNLPREKEVLNTVYVGQESQELPVNKEIAESVEEDQDHNLPREKEVLDTVYVGQESQENPLYKKIAENAKKNKSYTQQKENKNLETKSDLETKKQESAEIPDFILENNQNQEKQNWIKTKKRAKAKSYNRIKQFLDILEKPKKKYTLISAGIAGAAALVVIVLLVIILSTGGSEKWKFYDKDAIYSILSEDNLKVIDVFYGKIIQEPDISEVSLRDISLDAATQLVVDGKQDLYVITKKECSIIANDVSYAAMSVSGEGIVYTVWDDNGYKLYLYNIKKKKSELVAEELESYEHIVISADGKAVAYIGKDSRCCLYKNSRNQTETIKDAWPVALSAEGEYLYYVKNSNFYVAKSMKDVQKLGEEPSSIIFNRDMTQLLYSYNFKTYFCKNGEKMNIAVSSKGSAKLIMPDNVQINIYYGGNQLVCGIEELCEIVCDIDGGLYYINQQMEAQKIVGSYEECQVSADGMSLIYSRGNKLYKVKNMKKSLEAALVEEISYVGSFLANTGLNKIYFENEDKELMYMENGKKPWKVYDDFLYDREIIGDNLYFIGDFSRGTGTLYLSESGKKKKPISEVKDIDSIGGNIYYQTEDNELYLLDGDKAIKVLDEFE